MHVHHHLESMLGKKSDSRLAIPLVTISHQISTRESIVVRPTLGGVTDGETKYAEKSGTISQGRTSSLYDGRMTNRHDTHLRTLSVWTFDCLQR